MILSYFLLQWTMTSSKKSAIFGHNGHTNMCILRWFFLLASFEKPMKPPNQNHEVKMTLRLTCQRPTDLHVSYGLGFQEDGENRVRLYSLWFQRWCFRCHFEHCGKMNIHVWRTSLDQEEALSQQTEKLKTTNPPHVFCRKRSKELFDCNFCFP